MARLLVGLASTAYLFKRNLGVAQLGATFLFCKERRQLRTLIACLVVVVAMNWALDHFMGVKALEDVGSCKTPAQHATIISTYVGHWQQANRSTSGPALAGSLMAPYLPIGI